MHSLDQFLVTHWIRFSSNTSWVKRSNPAHQVFLFSKPKYFTIWFTFLEFLRSLDRLIVLIRAIISEFYPLVQTVSSITYVQTGLASDIWSAYAFPDNRWNTWGQKRFHNFEKCPYLGCHFYEHSKSKLFNGICKIRRYERLNELWFGILALFVVEMQIASRQAPIWDVTQHKFHILESCLKFEPSKHICDHFRTHVPVKLW